MSLVCYKHPSSRAIQKKLRLWVYRLLKIITKKLKTLIVPCLLILRLGILLLPIIDGKDTRVTGLATWMLQAWARPLVPVLSTPARRRWRIEALEILLEVFQNVRWWHPSTLHRTEDWPRNFHTEASVRGWAWKKLQVMIDNITQWPNTEYTACLGPTKCTVNIWIPG